MPSPEKEAHLNVNGAIQRIVRPHEERDELRLRLARVPHFLLPHEPVFAKEPPDVEEQERPEREEQHDEPSDGPPTAKVQLG